MTRHVSPLNAANLAPAPVVIADEQDRHVESRELLLDEAFGALRHEKTCERLREGRLPADGLALVATMGDRLVATVRLWNVTLGPSRPSLLLGPIAVDGALRSAGIGGQLIRVALGRARDEGHRSVILVGDEPYYRRFGFAVAKMDRLWMPGPLDRSRFLGLELVPGALDGVRGLVSPTGVEAPRWRDVELPGAWRIAA